MHTVTQSQSRGIIGRWLAGDIEEVNMFTGGRQAALLLLLLLVVVVLASAV